MLTLSIGREQIGFTNNANLPPRQLMIAALKLHPDRLFPATPESLEIARELFGSIQSLPIISPHGHVDPGWFATDAPFEDALSLFIWPDHYLLRMLYSRGVPLGSLGVAGGPGPVETDRRTAWRTFAANYFLFRGTPSRLWLDHAFANVFGLDVRLNAQTADHYYDTIQDALSKPEFRPRALFSKFNIEVIATTEGALDELKHHQTISSSGWKGRIIPTFRPDDVVDPDRPDFHTNLGQLSQLTGENTRTWKGYLRAIATRRQVFIAAGATATDHGHPSARTADLSPSACEALFDRIALGHSTEEEHELFRAQMLTEMARLSCDDGLVMQLHAGPWRNYNPTVFEYYGRDRGGDFPKPTNFISDLKPLLDRFGNDPKLSLILFTLDETTYSRELAPLAGHYPTLVLGPPWWFHDSPGGMSRFRHRVTETAGFYNTAGFNDDTRAYFSIPARHDVSRRMDCRFLAELVTTHQLDLDEALDVIHQLTYTLPKTVYRL